MTKFIKYQGYLRSSEGDWIHLGDELVFPSDGIPDNPFDYIQNLLKNSGIEYYLITYKYIFKE